MGKWDWLYERKSQPIKSWVMDEVAARLGAELRGWPLVVESWSSDQDKSRFVPVLERPRPPEPVFQLAFDLTRWDLERRFDEIDAYMRGERWRPRAKTTDDFDAAIFLWRWLTEQLEAFREATTGKFTRDELVELVTRIERRALDVAPSLLH